jgi:hypothetical protein
VRRRRDPLQGHARACWGKRDARVSSSWGSERSSRTSTSTRCFSTGHVRSKGCACPLAASVRRGDMSRRGGYTLRGTSTYAGGAHVSCRRCRNRSTTSCDRRFRFRSGHVNTGPKRVTVPGEAMSDVGSRWQNREIDVTELSEMRVSGGGSRSRESSRCTLSEKGAVYRTIDGRHLGSRGVAFLSRERDTSDLGQTVVVRTRESERTSKGRRQGCQKRTRKTIASVRSSR